jgi:hypothetical protein
MFFGATNPDCGNSSRIKENSHENHFLRSCGRARPGDIDWVQSWPKAFVNALVAVPCRVIRQARRLLFRVLAYNPNQSLFFRLVDVLSC